MKFSWIIPVSLCLIGATACHNEPAGGDPLLYQAPYAIWTDSIRMYPENSVYYYQRGKLFSQNNDSLRALRDLEKAISISNQPDYAIVLSSFWLDHGKPDSARAAVLPVVLHYPANQLLQRNLLMSYYDDGSYPEALRVNTTALSYDSTSSGNWYNRAMVLDALKDSASALRSLERALDLDPKNATIAYELANRYADVANPAALSLCDQIIQEEELTQKKPDPYTIKGIYYENAGKLQQAMDCFDQSIATDYTFMEAYLEKGMLLFRQKQYPEALKVFTLSTTVDNTFADGYYWTARSQQQLKQVPEARLNYERAIAFDKHFTEAREALAKLGK
jgi:tetratricopeptide (TPR) repeat protein